MTHDHAAGAPIAWGECLVLDLDAPPVRRCLDAYPDDHWRAAATRHDTERHPITTLVIVNALARFGGAALDLVERLTRLERAPAIVVTGHLEVALRGALAALIPSIPVVVPWRDPSGLSGWRRTSTPAMHRNRTRARALIAQVIAQDPIQGPVAEFPGGRPYVRPWRSRIVASPDVDPRALASWLVSSACDGGWITLAGSPLDSGLWKGTHELADWIATIRQQRPQCRICLCDRTHAYDAQTMRELAAAGLTRVRFGLSPRVIDSGAARLLAERIADAREAGMQVSAEGHLVPGIADWSRLREAWNCADRLGLDFVRTLARTPLPSVMDAPHAFSSRLWNAIRRGANACFMYESACIAVHHLYRPSTHARQSIGAFFDTSLDEVHRYLLSEISAAGTLDSGFDGVARACEWSQQRLAQILNQADAFEARDGHEIHDAHEAHDINDAHQAPIIDDASLTSIPVSPRSGRTRVAIVVAARDNAAHLRLCLTSLRRFTTHDFEAVLVDYGRSPLPPQAYDCGARVNVHRQVLDRARSIAITTGLASVSACDYVMWIDANACAMEADWLADLLREIENADGAGVLGVTASDRFDYGVDDVARHVKTHVLRARWRGDLGLGDDISDEQLLDRLSTRGRQCFNALDDWIQFYRGDVLRAIGLPAIDDPQLRLSGWGAEMSLRVQARGGVIVGSPTIARAFCYFGGRFDTGIHASVAYRRALDHDAGTLERLGHHDLADLLRSGGPERPVSAPPALAPIRS